MMKFLVAIAMVALIGFSLTSAAAVDLGVNNVAPGEMEDFQESLKTLLQGVSEQIKENAGFKEVSDVESFLMANEIDVEQDLVSSEEEEFANVGLSDAEDYQSDENVDSGIRCHWKGRVGKCCQSIKIIRFRITVCLAAHIMPPHGMRIVLSINKRTIWSKTVGNRCSYNICKGMFGLRFCIKIYNLSVSTHSARACLGISARYHFIRFKRRLGCFSRRFAADEIATTKDETSLRLLEKEEENKDLFFVSNENKKHSDDVSIFNQ